MNIGRFKAIVLIGALWVVVSAVVFALAVREPNGTQKAALAFLLFSEILTTALLARLESEDRSALRRVGFYGACAIYFILAAGTAVLHLSGVVPTWLWMAVGETVLAAGLLTVLILFHYASEGAAERTPPRSPARPRGSSSWSAWRPWPCRRP